MYRMTQLLSVFVLSFVLAAAPSFAEDPTGTVPADPAVETADPGEDTSAPVEAVPEDLLAAPEADLSAVPAAPAPVAPPALKPITITFSGEVASVAASDNPPMITVQDRYGVKKEISVPSETKIAAGTASKALTDLKAGDKVTVEYTYDVATGKRTAQTITIGEPTPAGS